MRTRILIISITVVAVLLGAFFITFSCSEIEDAATSAGGFTPCTDTNATGITSVSELEAVKDTLDGNFCLNQDIDLSSISNFEPIGSNTTPFTGTFDGNNKKIMNLSMLYLSGEGIGLFGETSISAEIKDLTIENSNIFSGNNIGTLVGTNRGTITNITTIGTTAIQGKYYLGGLIGENIGGTITNCTSNVNVTTTLGSDPNGSVGGLIGYNHSSSTITDCSTSGTINVIVDKVGGLVGYNDGSTITGCEAAGNVTGNSKTGGLVGSANETTITNSYATGSVEGTNYIGGLAGEAFDSTIEYIYATGTVTGTSDYVGGLFGSASGTTITNSYATGNVEGTNYIGGLIGRLANSSNNTNSYSTGAVTGTSSVGGLIGRLANNTISTNSYATGAVTGTSDYVGGLAGEAATSTTIKYSYATGTVTTSSSNKGGLLGSISSTTLTDNYFDTDTTGLSVGIGNSTSTDVTGITTADITSGGSLPFSNNSWNFTTIWSAAGNSTWPTLQ